MNKMFRFALLCLPLVFAATAAGQVVCDTLLEVPLVAGQHDQIGMVTFCTVGDVLYVNYNTDPGTCLVEAHVYVGDTPPEKGAPGQFPYGPGEMGSCESDVNLDPIDISGMGSPLYLAAHGVSIGEENCTQLDFDCAGFIASAPGCLAEEVTHPGTADASYFDIGTLGGGPAIPNATYPGWCVDTDSSISTPVLYDALVIPACDPELLNGIIEYYENMDMVNWLINQEMVGEPSGCDGAYTYGDVQRAIWELIEDNIPQGEAGLGPWEPCRVTELVDMAMADGEGFTPDCGDPMAIVLGPVADCGDTNIIAQPQVITIPAPCETECGDETAWALFSWVPLDAARFTNRRGTVTGWGEYYPRPLP